MQVVIIEDEKPSARRLNRMLKGLELEVIVMLHSVNDAVEWFKNNEHPELIFLDIQLSDGLSFEIFEKVEIKSAIIFTTAYDEYALKAFKLNSVDYLLKPIDDEELEEAVQKYASNSAKKSPSFISAEDIQKMFQQPSPKEYKKRFTIQVGQHLKIFEVNDICCFYSENKGTYLHTNNDRSYLLDLSLEKLEQDLDPNKFFKISRKFIVNLNAIKDIVSYSNLRLEVKLECFNKHQLIVSRERVKLFKEWLE
ncbi:LytTR family two component transcriptional regulator [Gillisia mitskevichiae]|uniref:LytTR family two component transcriptional regulator n=1 Tax=Gillisia mitskevichiae TaxID=270921 RepID=A0A495PRV5_9FLAO|nr:LytTR family DNA-binding domain-containing protein [Gillisia mitskevichiae]RKS53343.1 LytTR family two component transcriptional regulator [Gillisia mitskevichiae]